jgi:hypothetical protein
MVKTRSRTFYQKNLQPTLKSMFLSLLKVWKEQIESSKASPVVTAESTPITSAFKPPPTFLPEERADAIKRIKAAAEKVKKLKVYE